MKYVGRRREVHLFLRSHSQAMCTVLGYKNTYDVFSASESKYKPKSKNIHTKFLRNALKMIKSLMSGFI